VITGEWVRGCLDRLICMSRNTTIEGMVCYGVETGIFGALGIQLLVSTVKVGDFSHHALLACTKISFL